MHCGIPHGSGSRTSKESSGCATAFIQTPLVIGTALTPRTLSPGLKGYSTPSMHPMQHYALQCHALHSHCVYYHAVYYLMQYCAMHAPVAVSCSVCTFVCCHAVCAPCAEPGFACTWCRTMQCMHVMQHLQLQSVQNTESLGSGTVEEHRVPPCLYTHRCCMVHFF